MPTYLQKAGIIGAQILGDNLSLYHDDFITAESAPIASPRTAEPGPGTATTTDPDSKIAIASSELQIAISGAGGNFDTYYESNQLSNAPGVIALAKMTTSTRGDLSYSSGAAPGTPRHEPGTSFIRVTSGGFVDTSLASTTNDVMGIAIANNDLLHFLLYDDSAGKWTRTWVSSGVPGANPRLRLLRVLIGNTPTWPFARVKQFAPQLFNPEVEHLGSVALNTSGNAPDGDILLKVEMDTLPSAGNVDIAFRQQDATHEWILRINSAGDLSLQEDDAGLTQRANAAAVLSGGETLTLVADGTTIRAWYDNTQAWSYASAINFATETAYDVNDLGTGGDISDLRIWRRFAAGALLNNLNLAVA